MESHGNVWIVNPFDNLPTEGNRPQRYWLMASAFVRAGWRVAYWTGDFSHARKARRAAVRTVPSEGIDVMQIPVLPYAKNVCWARVRSHRRLARDFARFAAARAAAAGAPQLVVASVPPLGLAAAALRMARTRGAVFVADVQDAWPETFERILPRCVWTLLGLRRTARAVYRGADGVSAVAQRYLTLARDYGCRAPTHLAGHAIARRDAADASGTVVHPSDGPLRLVYAGNMSLSYDLATVIAVVKEVPFVTLDIAGNGPDLERLRTHAGEEAGDGGRIRFHGYLDDTALAALLARCDVGLVPMFPESCVGVPGKLADYAAAGLRVIESLGGECRERVMRFGAGVHYTAGDASSFRMAVSALAKSKRCVPPPAFAASFDAVPIMDAYVAWCTGLPGVSRRISGSL